MLTMSTNLGKYKPIICILNGSPLFRCNAERQKALAERAELEEFQKTQQELRERELEERIRAETRNPSVVVGHHQQYCLFLLFMFILCLKINSFNSGAKVDREAEIIPVKVIGGSCEAERCSRCEGGGQGAEGRTAAGKWKLCRGREGGKRES